MSRLWVWEFVVVCVGCKRVVKGGYPALWRVLAALLVIGQPDAQERGSKAPRNRRGANFGRWHMRRSRWNVSARPHVALLTLAPIHGCSLGPN